MPGKCGGLPPAFVAAQLQTDLPYSLVMASPLQPQSSVDLSASRRALGLSDWARRFQIDAPVSYKEALELAMEPRLRVFLRYTDESAEPQWVICVEERPDFWMDAFETRSEATSLCKKMGWKVVRP